MSESVSTWDQKFQNCVQFHADNGKFPRQHSNNEAERKLGKWIAHQKSALAGKDTYKLTQDRIEKIRPLLSQFKDYDVVWDQKMTEIEQISTDQQLNGKLRNWLSRQKCALIGKGACKMNELRRSRLTNLLIQRNEFDLIDYKWDLVMSQCEQFKQKNGRYPSKKSTEQPEKRLGKWLSIQVEALNQLDLERSEKLSIYLQEYKSQDQTWRDYMIQCQQFKQDTSRRPSQFSKVLSEKKLGKWLNDQKRLMDCNTLKNTEQCIQLRQFFLELKTIDLNWDEKMTRCEQFKDEHKRLPKQTCKDLNEKRLAKWLSKQKGVIDVSTERSQRLRKCIDPIPQQIQSDENDFFVIRLADFKK